MLSCGALCSGAVLLGKAVLVSHGRACLGWLRFGSVR